MTPNEDFMRWLLSRRTGPWTPFSPVFAGQSVRDGVMMLVEQGWLEEHSGECMRGECGVLREYNSTLYAHSKHYAFTLKGREEVSAIIMMQALERGK